jgi:hypothetical protein
MELRNPEGGGTHAKVSCTIIMSRLCLLEHQLVKLVLPYRMLPTEKRVSCKLARAAGLYYWY